MDSQTVKTLIFDLDGTLCTYGLSLEDSLEKCFQDVDDDIPEIRAEDYEEEFGNQFDMAIDDEVERPDLNFRERIFVNLLSGDEEGEGDKPLSEGEILDLARKFTEIREGSLHLFEEVPEVIGDLKGAFKLGMLTNGPSDLQRSKIEVLDIESWFDDIVVSGEHGLAKPDPGIFEIALNRLEAGTEETVYIGNSPQYDILGANNAGIPVIWRKDEDEEEVEEAIPDLIVEDLRPLANGIELKPGDRSSRGEGE
ncbi:MAG: HAD family hydrolase [Candidatus Acetothermia bacterium]